MRDLSSASLGETSSATSKLVKASRAMHQRIADGDWVRAILARVEPPTAPATQTWRLSIPALVARHPKIPAVAAWPLRKLGRFGEVMIGPGGIGFDGRNVPWDRVGEIRTHSTAGLVPDAVVDREITRIRELLPPIPGRTWVLSQLVVILLTLARRRAADERDDSVIACEIRYRNRLGRPKRLTAGLLGAAILTAFPAVNDSVIATAQSKGVSVRPAPPRAGQSRAERADRLRTASVMFAARVRAIIAGGEDDRDKQ